MSKKNKLGMAAFAALSFTLLSIPSFAEDVTVSANPKERSEHRAERRDDRRDERRDNMTDEQKDKIKAHHEEMKAKFDAMSPEERKAAMEKHRDRVEERRGERRDDRQDGRQK